jgi:hypothetical protein
MKKNPTDEGRFTEHGHGLGTVTEDMVRKRAEELALIAGRPNGVVLDMDYREARRELTGKQGTVSSPREEQLPEEARWEEVSVSEGHRVPEVPASDEQTFAEELVEEGVDDAEQDSMADATRDQARRDEAEGE